MHFYTQQVREPRGVPGASAPRPVRSTVVRRDPAPGRRGGGQEQTLAESPADLEKRWACPLGRTRTRASAWLWAPGFQAGFAAAALRPAPPSGLRVAEAPRRTLASGPILRAPEASGVM